MQVTRIAAKAQNLISFKSSKLHFKQKDLKEELKSKNLVPAQKAGKTADISWKNILKTFNSYGKDKEVHVDFYLNGKKVTARVKPHKDVYKKLQNMDLSNKEMSKFKTNVESTIIRTPKSFKENVKAQTDAIKQALAKTLNSAH